MKVVVPDEPDEPAGGKGNGKGEAGKGEAGKGEAGKEDGDPAGTLDPTPDSRLPSPGCHASTSAFAASCNMIDGNTAPVSRESARDVSTAARISPAR